jgi:hypothetical protein
VEMCVFSFDLFANAVIIHLQMCLSIHDCTRTEGHGHLLLPPHPLLLMRLHGEKRGERRGHTTPPRRFSPTDKAKSRNLDRGGRSFSTALPRACHHVERLNISRPSGISFSPKSALPPSPPPHHRGLAIFVQYNFLELPRMSARPPPRQFSPTDKAKSRQRRARFQHRVTLGLLSCRVTQYFTSVRYQLHPQICTPSPPNTSHCRAGFCQTIKRTPDSGGRGFSIALPRACHHAEGLNISRPSDISFSSKPALPSPAHHTAAPVFAD